jgi:hypothetical protein
LPNRSPPERRGGGAVVDNAGGGGWVELSDMVRELRIKSELNLTKVLGLAGVDTDSAWRDVDRVLKCLAADPPSLSTRYNDVGEGVLLDAFALGRPLLAKHAMERVGREMKI